MGTPLHEKMANIACSYFGSQMSQTNSKEIKEKISPPGNCLCLSPLLTQSSGQKCYQIRGKVMLNWPHYKNHWLRLWQGFCISSLTFKKKSLR